MMRSLLKASVCLLLLQQSLAFVAQQREVPDEETTTPEMIAKHNYPAEIHHITTEDGYILEVHRMPYSPKSPATEGRPVVLMHHGLLSSSFDWIVQGPGASLAYLFTDLGFDVWLLNGRGNRYSRNHTTLDPNGTEFWKFSWHEIGVYDLPAVIDYALDLTGQEQVYYVGHSMGTTASLVLLSEKPDYNAKVKEVALLAPVATLTHCTNSVRLLVPFLGPLGALGTLIGHGEFLPGERFTESPICKHNSTFQEICTLIVDSLLNWDTAELNTTLVPVILSHVPAGAATRDVIHYGQVIRDKRFQKYDHGKVTNLIVYGQEEPPLYDLSKVTARVSLHYGDKDDLADPTDVQWLSEQLPNLEGLYRVPLSTFSHVDFIWAKDIDTLVNNLVISIMTKYE